jgi:hypothetical protein
LIECITDEVNVRNPGLGTVLAERAEAAYQNEETFFLLRYLRGSMGDVEFEAMVEAIVAREGVEAFLLPGVKERLLLADELTDVQPSWGILTYGDAVDQEMKLRLIGLAHVPRLVIDSPDKSALLRQWQNRDGTFTLPAAFGGTTVDTLTLEDDKLRTFFDMPEGVIGIWVNARPHTARHLATAGYRIKVVKDLFESAKYLEDVFL